jgi:hypothetical protein
MREMKASAAPIIVAPITMNSFGPYRSHSGPANGPVSPRDMSSTEPAVAIVVRFQPNSLMND